MYSHQCYHATISYNYHIQFERWFNSVFPVHRWCNRRLNGFPRTSPLQVESLTLPLLLPLPLPLQLPLLSLIRTSTPKVLSVRRHAIRDFPSPLVELDRLRGFNAAHQSIALELAWLAKRLDFPALIRMRYNFAVR